MSSQAKSHYIAIISDTHGLLRPEVTDRLKSCEAILHAGDFGSPDILKRLEEIAPVYAVRGNVDGAWADSLPAERVFTLFGFQFYMIHNREQVRRSLQDMDIVVYGHSHKYEEYREEGTLYMNPGSCGPSRFRLPVTMLLVRLYPKDRWVETQRIYLDSHTPAAVKEPAEVDMHKLVKTIMKEVRAGRTVAQIAARNHVSEELAEQICRFYVTHPGVDVDGILDRIERKNL